MELFYPPEQCNAPQLMFLTVVYGVILYQSSNLIAAGSELLLLFPAVAGIVGSVVLPILGAVPDGVMVLFSGLGPDAQNQVSVGVGALAGSTVMLLTFPWFIAVMSGAVPMVEGTPKYGPGEGSSAPESGKGVQYQASLQKASKIMLGTTLLYLVIQLPASLQETKTSDTLTQAKAESIASLVGLIMCIAAFFGYLAYCFKDANEDKELEAVIDGIKAKTISIGTALRFAKDNVEGAGSAKSKMTKKSQEKLSKIVRPFFRLYDADNSKSLDVVEFKNLLHELGERHAQDGIEEELKKRDTNGNGKVEFEELVEFLAEYLEDTRMERLTTRISTRKLPAFDEEDEEEEVPTDLADLSPAEQHRRLLFRSFWMMGLGTLLVLIFSDPMVDILSDWGRRMDISPFYVSFILAPFASNASELLSAYTYASKKSSKSITTSLSTLVGAACMNNTFCLAIFLALVYCKNLAWQFTAETVAIVVIQWVIGLLTIKSKVQSTTTAFIILACYPGCLFVVWALENIVGLD